MGKHHDRIVAVMGMRDTTKWWRAAEVQDALEETYHRDHRITPVMITLSKMAIDCELDWRMRSPTVEEAITQSEEHMIIEYRLAQGITTKNSAEIGMVDSTNLGLI